MYRFAIVLLVSTLVWGCARPITNFATPAPTVQAGEVVRFENNTQKAVAYQWSFGDGRTSTLAEPEHRFLESGAYTVVLEATNEKGKSKAKRQLIEVVPPTRCLLYIETPQGEMIAQLYDATPLHQDNFLKLVGENYYDSLLFHRVINAFMIQGGDPNSRGAGPDTRLGSGGPGYTTPAEFVDSLAHVKGALAAARTQNPQKASSGSQFYIVQGKNVTDEDLNQVEANNKFRYPSSVRNEYLEVGGTPFLDQNYTVFGRLIDGFDVLDRIAGTATQPGDRPVTDVWMKIRIIR
jgi:peptidyl-prolyl cis-trans isomerase B (cyclophilin B)